jgi:hypothetical protein
MMTEREQQLVDALRALLKWAEGAAEEIDSLSGMGQSIAAIEASGLLPAEIAQGRAALKEVSGS